jgi:hypothetical protein
MKDLRTAAKIEYVGKFAEASASAPAANALNGPSEPDTPSTPAIAPANTSSIDQGMGVNK